MTLGEHFELADLLDYPAALATVADWINAEWGVFSGRTLEQTRLRFTSGIERGRLPVTRVALTRSGVCGGVASLREHDTVDFVRGASPWICNVYVDPFYRQSGLASRLCWALESDAQRLGYPAIYLATTRADSLYRRLGYEDVKQAEHDSRVYWLLRKPIV